MIKNKILPPYDNKVVLEFSFTGTFAVNGLNNFDEVTVEIGDESYSSIDNPAQLVVDSETQLTLSIGDTTALLSGVYIPKITGFNTTYDDGYILNDVSRVNLEGVIVVTRED